MDIFVTCDNAQKMTFDETQIKKMAFVYNALDNGWSIKKRNGSYIFTKLHEGKKEIFDENYLAIFMKENTKLFGQSIIPTQYIDHNYEG